MALDILQDLGSWRSDRKTQSLIQGTLHCLWPFLSFNLKLSFVSANLEFQGHRSAR